MIDDIFVFDCVIHVTDTSDENTLPGDGQSGRDSLIALSSGVIHPDAMEYVPSMKHAFTSEEVYDLVFTHGLTDMAMAQVVPIFDWFENWFAPIEAQHALATAYPDRVLFCGGVDPKFNGLAEALDQLTYQVEELGAKSFKFYNGHAHKSWRCDDEELAYPMYQRCLDLGVDVVQFHKGFPFGNMPLAPLSPLDIERAALDFPDMRFVIHHLAVPFFEEVCSLAARHENVYLALSANLNLLHVAPRLVQQQVGQLLSQVDVHKLMWGSEAALVGSPAPYLRKFVDMEIPDDLRQGYGYPQITREDKELILGRNFAALMGIDIDEKRRELVAVAS
jgi:predicted TIM-barrel fold metal-dependent hydrolase